MLNILELTTTTDSWKADATCAAPTIDLEVFFDKKTETEALAHCAGCPVVGDCLLQALINMDTDGVAGETTGAQRKPLIQAVKDGDDATLLAAGLGRGDRRTIEQAWLTRREFQNWEKSYLQREQAVTTAALTR